MSSRILIIEQSEIIRKGIVHILYESGLFADVSEMSHATNVPDIIERERPDVLIIGLGTDTRFMENPGGDHSFMPKIVALSSGACDDANSGTYDGVIHLHDKRDKIIKMLGRLSMTSGDNPAGESQLSEREKDVLRLLVRGHSNKEISVQLFISIHTVMSHRKNIVRKLNIRSVAGLTVYAMLNGLASMDELK